MRSRCLATVIEENSDALPITVYKLRFTLPSAMRKSSLNRSDARRERRERQKANDLSVSDDVIESDYRRLRSSKAHGQSHEWLQAV